MTDTDTRRAALLRHHLQHDHDGAGAGHPTVEHAYAHAFHPVQHQHAPCPQPGCLGELVRLNAGSPRPAPFECTACHALHHTAACRDEAGALECCCGLADAVRTAAEQGMVRR